MNAHALAQNLTTSHALRPTPGQILGPYYPVSPNREADADLTRWPGAERRAAGARLEVSGRVTDVFGRPISGALIECWQCDVEGRYRHPDAPEHELVDPDFEGYGRVVTARDGGYAVTALKPVPYPGRAPHLHYRIAASGFAELITQMYIEGDPQNDEDFALLRAGDDAAQALLLVDLLPIAEARPEEAYRGVFDIVLEAV